MLIIDWKQEAERLIFDEKISYNKTTEHLVKNHKDFKGLSERKAKDKLRSYIRRTDKYKAKQAENNGENYSKSIQHNADGSTTFEGIVRLMDGEPITPEAIMKAHNLKPDDWEVVTYKTNFWQAQQKGGGTMLLYQSKITVKPKTGSLSLDAIDEHFRQLDRQNFIPPNIIIRNGKFMSEINIADLHLGKLCWHGNTGVNYDYKIAKDIYYNAINEICHEIRHKDNEYITFVWSNDFFNADTIGNTTTGMTPQECDVRWQKMYDIGVEMLVRGIETIQEKLKVPVKTFYTPSNHDEINGYHAIKRLEAWFRKDKNVIVDTSAYPRKYQLFGTTLLGYAHGNKENSKGNKDKASRLASLMPIEVPELWSKSKTREFHTAHLHSEQMIQEINGVIVRRISSPTAADTWHTENGFIGAVRKTQTFVYDKQRGLIHTINTPVEVSV